MDINDPVVLLGQRLHLEYAPRGRSKACFEIFLPVRCVLCRTGETAWRWPSVGRYLELDGLHPKLPSELGFVGEDLGERALSSLSAGIEVVDVSREAAGNPVEDHFTLRGRFL